MQNLENLEQSKLLQLLEAVESVLDHEDSEEMLGADILGQFADIRNLVRGWLLDDSSLTPDQRLDILANFTDILAKRNLVMDRNKAQLH